MSEERIGQLLLWLLRQPGKAWSFHITRRGEQWELRIGDDEGHAIHAYTHTKAAALQLKTVLEHVRDVESRKTATAHEEATARFNRQLEQRRKSDSREEG